MAGRKPNTYWVCLHGEQFDLVYLCAETGVPVETVFSRWDKLGRVYDITPHEEILSTWSRSHREATWFTLEGILTNPTEASKATGISVPVIKRIIKVKGRCLLMADLGSSRKRKDRLQTGAKRRAKTQPIAPAKQEPCRNVSFEDKAPGWAERKYFADAGKNGFAKVERDAFVGFDSKRNSVYSGSR